MRTKLLVIVSCLTSSYAVAAPLCQMPKTWDDFHSTQKSKIEITSRDRSDRVVSILLYEALSLSPDFLPCLQPHCSSVNGENKEGLHVTPASSLPAPADRREFVATWAEQITKGLDKPLASKKILPFLHPSMTNTSWENLFAGRLLLEKPTPASIGPAIAAFEAAIRSDYNFVPAYLGLAEALAIRYALEGDEAVARRAHVELAKAQLLNPVLSKIKEDRIQWYLTKDRKNLKEICGDSKK